MRRKAIATVFAVLFVLGASAMVAQAETLAWNAVTTYTDGSSIGSATVTYTAYWSASSGLTNLQSLGSASTATSRSINADSAGMSRGSTIYFTVKATVGGVDSSLAPAFSWNVPSKAPSAPANLRMN